MRLILTAALLFATPAVAQTAPQAGDVAVHLAPGGRTQFTLVTPSGYIGFASGDWAVINIHSVLPAAAFEFQVPDPADQGTAESTNISIEVYQPATREARNAEAQFGKSLEPAGRPKMETYKDWTIYSQGVVAKGTPYSLMDAESRQGDVEVMVHLNWPHLSGQPGMHNTDMRALMLKTLDSVTAGTGAYAVQPGETVRRFAGKAQ